MENMNKCPGCSQHCDRNNLQCGKGKAIFNGEAAPDSGHSHSNHERNFHGHEGKHCGHHEGKPSAHCEGKHHGHGHRRPEFPAGSLADLMAKCGHRLFHGGDESMFAVLNEEEETVLKGLLVKLLSN